MGTNVGIYREEKEMRLALGQLAKLKEQLKKVTATGPKAYNPGWHLCQDLKNMLIASEAIAASALSRKESRGAHSRIDFPKTDPELGKANTTVSKNADEMKLEHIPLPKMPDDLMELFKQKEPPHA